MTSFFKRIAFLNTAQVVKLVIANTIAQSSATSRRTSSAAFAGMLATWLETAPIASAARTGAMDLKVAHLVDLPKEGSEEEMRSTANTSSSCKSFLVALLLAMPSNALKLDLEAMTTELVLATTVAVVISNHGNEDLQEHLRPGNSAVTTDETIMAGTEVPLLHGHVETTTTAVTIKGAMEALLVVVRPRGNVKTTLLRLRQADNTDMGDTQAATTMLPEATVVSLRWERRQVSVHLLVLTAPSVDTADLVVVLLHHLPQTMRLLHLPAISHRHHRHQGIS